MQLERPLERPVVKGSARQGLAAATFGFFVGFMAVALISPNGPTFKATMGLSTAELGILLAAPNLSGSLLRIPFGAWVDKTGGKKPLLTLLVIGIAGLAGLTAVLTALYPKQLTISMYPLMVGLAVLCGAGVAVFSVGIPQTSYWFPQKKQGMALGVYAGLGNTAPGVVTLILPFAVLALGIPGTYAAWLGFVVIGTLVYYLIARDAPFFQLTKKGLSREQATVIAREMGEELIPSGQLVQSLKVSARKWRNWALVGAYFTSFGGFLALTTWFPTYWALFHGFDARSAAVATALSFSLLASITRAASGTVSDRIGGENAAMVAFALVAVGSLMMLSLQDLASNFAGAITMGVGMGIGNAAVFKLVARYVPEAVGGASGWVGGLGAFGGFVVPPILGWFVDAYGKSGYSTGFATYLVLGLLSIGIMATLRAYRKGVTAKA